MLTAVSCCLFAASLGESETWAGQPRSHVTAQVEWQNKLFLAFKELQDAIRELRDAMDKENEAVLVNREDLSKSLPLRVHFRAVFDPFSVFL